MKRSTGTSPITAIALISAYFGGILTVAVICCDDVLLPGETEHISASPPFDAGGVGSSDSSLLAFVFEEETEGITGLISSVHQGASEVPLDGAELYRAGNVLVVEVSAERGQVFQPHFYFLNRDGEVVKEYWVYLSVDRSLLTYDEQQFGNYLKPIYHNQPTEIEAEVGDCFEIPLEQKSRIWFNGEFHDLWQVVRLPSGSHAASPSKLVEVDQPFVVGIAGGIEGETVSLEVLSQ